MYDAHFGLETPPFRMTPDTRLFYDGGGRGELLEALVYAINSGEGMVKVVGEVGAGKTMMCRMLEDRLPEHVEIVYLANPSLSPDDILLAIALEMDLPVEPDANRVQVMHALQQHLLEKHAHNRRVVMFVEEAQSMPLDTLEEIRLLSNLETKQDKLLQIVLFGQPELDENLSQPRIRQLRERITHSFYLPPFTPDETREYLNHRLRGAGYKGPELFGATTTRPIAQAADGLTRRINILADKAMLAAFAEDTHDISRRHIRIAIDDSHFTRPGTRPTALLVATGLAVAVAGAAWVILDLPIPFLQGSPAGEAVAGAPPLAVAAAAMPAPPPSPPAPGPSPETTAGPGESALARPAVPPVSPGETAPTETGPAAAEGAALAAPAATISEPSGAMPASAGVTPGVPAPVASADDGSKPTGVATPAPAVIAPASAVAAPADPPPDPAVAPMAVAALSAPAAVTVAEATPAREPTGWRYGPLLSDRMDATESWLGRVDPTHYSIQLFLTGREQHWAVEEFLARRRLAGELDDVFVYETEIGARPVFSVMFREFEQYVEAKQALESLPGPLKYPKPFVRILSDVRVIR